MNFIELCKNRFEKYKSVLCIGIDPEIEKIPYKNKSNIKNTLIKFYFSIIENFYKYTFVLKPNIAFFEQYGIEGSKALKEIIKKAREYEIPVILDAKRNDIGNTAKAYAKAAFNELEVDAITLNPYLGEDSLIPFFEFKDKGFFILARTSNIGGNDFQKIKTESGEYLYTEVTNKIGQWNQKYSNNIGAVAGATQINELKKITSIFSNFNYPPLLIPGIGKQGGDFNTVINILKEKNYPFYKVFINSSSKINYAYIDHPDKDYLEASLIEIKKMLINI